MRLTKEGSYEFDPKDKHMMAVALALLRSVLENEDAPSEYSDEVAEILDKIHALGRGLNSQAYNSELRLLRKQDVISGKDRRRGSSNEGAG